MTTEQAQLEAALAGLPDSFVRGVIRLLPTHQHLPAFRKILNIHALAEVPSDIVDRLVRLRALLMTREEREEVCRPLLEEIYSRHPFLRP